MGAKWYPSHRRIFEDLLNESMSKIYKMLGTQSMWNIFLGLHCLHSFVEGAIAFSLPVPQPLQWLGVSPLQFTFIQTVHNLAKMFADGNPSLVNESHAFVPHRYIFLSFWTVAKLIVLVLCKLSAKFKIILVLVFLSQYSVAHGNSFINVSFTYKIILCVNLLFISCSSSVEQINLPVSNLQDSSPWPWNKCSSDWENIRQLLHISGGRAKRRLIIILLKNPRGRVEVTAKQVTLGIFNNIETLLELNPFDLPLRG